MLRKIKFEEKLERNLVNIQLIIILGEMWKKEKEVK